MIREILTDLINFGLNTLMPTDGLDEIEQKERSAYVCAISLIFWGFILCVWINSKNCVSEEGEENGDQDKKDECNNDKNNVEVLPVVNNEKLVDFNKFTQDLHGNMMFEPVRNDNVTEYYLKRYKPNNGYMINSNYEPITFVSSENNKLKRFILID